MHFGSLFSFLHCNIRDTGAAELLHTHKVTRPAIGPLPVAPSHNLGTATQRIQTRSEGTQLAHDPTEPPELA
jgi:hypothetical protein